MSRDRGYKSITGLALPFSLPAAWRENPTPLSPGGVGHGGGDEGAAALLQRQRRGLRGGPTLRLLPRGLRPLQLLPGCVAFQHVWTWKPSKHEAILGANLNGHLHQLPRSSVQGKEGRNHFENFGPSEALRRIPILFGENMSKPHRCPNSRSRLLLRLLSQLLRVAVSGLCLRLDLLGLDGCGLGAGLALLGWFVWIGLVALVRFAGLRPSPWLRCARTRIREPKPSRRTRPKA